MFSLIKNFVVLIKYSERRIDSKVASPPELDMPYHLSTSSAASAEFNCASNMHDKKDSLTQWTLKRNKNP